MQATEAQTKAILEENKFVVTYTIDYGNKTAVSDKTFNEIKAAFDAGKIITATWIVNDAKYERIPLYLLSSSDYSGVMSSLAQSAAGGDIISLMQTSDGVLYYSWSSRKERPKSVSVTLTASGWNSSTKTQTVTVSGVDEDETSQLIQPTPAVASQSAYYTAGIIATGQAKNKLTFTATTIPTVDLTVYVVLTELQS